MTEPDALVCVDAADPPVFTMAGAHLREVEIALEHARDCLMGKAPDGMNPNEQWGIAMDKVETALHSHIPAVRARMSR